MNKLDLLLGQIPDEKFKFLTKAVKNLVRAELKKKVIGKFGIILGSPVYWLSYLLVSFFYYSFVLPKREIAKNKLKAKKFKHRIDRDLDKFEKTKKIDDFIDHWKHLNNAKL